MKPPNTVVEDAAAPLLEPDASFLADASPEAALPEAASSEDAAPGCVLIVDDLPVNVRLLSGILRFAGYDTMEAGSGLEALSQLAQRRPDVVLLDVMMPGMDGFEVCRRIKSDPETAYLPVVIVTALQETSDRVQALEAGADDFLTKPVDETEVLARVQSLVRMYRQRGELERAYHELRRVEAMRDSLTHMLVHDLRAPLTNIMVPLDLLSDDRLDPADPARTQLIQMCRRGTSRLLGLVNQILDVNKMESGQMTLDRRPIHIADVIEDALSQITLLARDQQVNFVHDIAPDVPIVPADKDLMGRVLVNLLDNAVKYSPRQGSITISCALGVPNSEDANTQLGTPDAELVVCVRDEGSGIAPEDRERIFGKFIQAQSGQIGRRTSSGLGLNFCKMAVEAHGGRIWVESSRGRGSTFCFAIPLER